MSLTNTIKPAGKRSKDGKEHMSSNCLSVRAERAAPMRLSRVDQQGTYGCVG